MIAPPNPSLSSRKRPRKSKSKHKKAAAELSKLPAISLIHDDSLKEDKELELEDLVFGGDLVSDRRKELRWNALKLGTGNAIGGESDDEDENHDGIVQDIESQDDVEDLDNEDLFTLDTKGKEGINSADDESSDDSDEQDVPQKGPVWVDDDGEDIQVDLTAKNRTKKLRVSESESVIKSSDYEERLRAQYEKLHPRPEWATKTENQEETVDILKLLRTATSLIGRRNIVLDPETLSMTRMKDANQMAYSQSVIQSAKFHPTAPVLMTAGFDKTVRLFQIDGKINPKIQSVFIKDLPISCASFTPDGKEIFLSGKRRFMFLYNLTTGTVNKVRGIRGRDEESYERHFMSPCNNQIAVTGRDGNILLLSRDTKQWIGSMKMNATVKDLEFTRDGKYLLSVAGNGDAYQWDLRQRKCIHRFADVGAVKTTSMAISPDEQYLALGLYSGIANIYSLPDCLSTTTAKPLKAITNLTTSITNLNFHPDSQLLSISSRAKKDALKMVNVKSLTVYAKWPTSNTPLSYVNCVDYSPSGGYIAIGNDKGRVLLYRIGEYADATAYDANDKPLYLFPANTWMNSNNSLVSYYMVGNGTKKLEVWSPFNKGSPADSVSVVFVQVAREIVNETRDANGHDTIRIKIKQAGWGDVGGVRICGIDATTNKTLECPDIILLGTSQLGGRFSNGDSIVLDKYFGKWFRETGIALTMDFLKGTYLDYSDKVTWQGLPLISDIRILMFNRTDIDNAKLEYPPPMGKSWETPYYLNWTWDALADYAKLIKDANNVPGFSVPMNWDEEMKLLPILMLNSNTGIFNAESPSDGCGLRDPNFQAYYDRIIRRMYQVDKSMDPYFYDETNPKAKQFIASPMEDPLTWGTKWGILDGHSYVPEIRGIRFDTVARLGDPNVVSRIYDPITNPTGDIGYAYVPGTSTFLGGSGLILTSGSKNPDLAWRLMSYMIDRRKTYLTRLSIAVGSPPPFDSAAYEQQWNSKIYEFVFSAMRSAVPPQFPAQTIPQFGPIESLKPGRFFMLESLQKNYNTSLAASRACMVMDDIFAKACTTDDYYYELSDCKITNTRSLTFKWKLPKKCKTVTSIGKVGATLPANQEIECENVNEQSAQAIGLIAFSAVGIFLDLVYSVLFYKYRKAEAIMASSPTVNQVFLLGSVLIHISVALRVGSLEFLCSGAHIIVFAYGFAMAFGAMAVKMVRIYSIFSNQSKMKLNKALTDFNLIALIGLILLIQTGLLLLYFFHEGGPHLTLKNQTIPGWSETIAVQACAEASIVSVAVLLTTNVFLILFCMVLAVKIRNVPAKFQEAKFCMVTVIAAGFIIIVIVPVLLSIPNERTNFLLYGLSTNFTTVLCVSFFAVGKIKEVFNPTVSTGGGSQSGSKMPTSGFLTSGLTDMEKMKSTFGNTDHNSKHIKAQAATQPNIMWTSGRVSHSLSPHSPHYFSPDLSSIYAPAFPDLIAGSAISQQHASSSSAANNFTPWFQTSSFIPSNIFGKDEEIPIEVIFANKVKDLTQKFQELNQICLSLKSTALIHYIDSLLDEFRQMLQRNELALLLLTTDDKDQPSKPQVNLTTPLPETQRRNSIDKQFDKRRTISLGLSNSEIKNVVSSDSDFERIGRTRSLSSGDILFPQSRPSTSNRVASPPFVKRSHETTASEIQKKQLRAQELRDSYLLSKSEKHKFKADRIEQIQLRQKSLQRQLKESIEEKQVKAEKLREIHLERIKNKAADENQKLEEIAIISALSSEHKKMEFQQRHLESEARLAELEDERHRKQLDAAALKEAAEKRRRVQEAERVAKIERDNQRKKDLETKKELEKQNSIAQRAASKIEKVLYSFSSTELQKLIYFGVVKKIETLPHLEEIRRGSLEITEKLNKGAERYFQYIEQRKEKAAAANQHSKIVANKVIAQRSPSEKRQIANNHENDTPPTEASNIAIDKALKKKIKRLKQRVLENADGYQYFPTTKTTSTSHSQHKKTISQLLETIKSQHRKVTRRRTPDQATDIENLEKSLKTLNTHFEAGNVDHVEMFYAGGVDFLVSCCRMVEFSKQRLVYSGVIHQALLAMINWYEQEPNNKQYILMHTRQTDSILIEKNEKPTTNNKTTEMICLDVADLLTKVLPMCVPGSFGFADDIFLVGGSLMKFVSGLIRCTCEGNVKMQKTVEDFVCYIVMCEVIEKLNEVIVITHAPLDPEFSLSFFLQQSVEFIDAVASFNCSSIPVYESQSTVHPALNSFRSTYLVGVLTMLDALLLQQTGNFRMVVPKQIPPTTISISLSGIKALNQICRVDLEMVQNVLIFGSMQMELFHLVAFWIGYWGECNDGRNERWGEDVGGKDCGEGWDVMDELLEELVVFIGYVALGDSANKAILRFGQSPTILQMLGRLPIRYFIDPRFKEVLFPTLIVGCFEDEDNQVILKEEMSLELLAGYIQKKLEGGDDGEAKDLRAHLKFVSRFPKVLWETALSSLS
ncbi:U3 snoRNP protein [Nowakowskiella sp. JEL0407]|nr:U3 snoRNP protein [Nowakowskiella sp. JEL0407]